MALRHTGPAQALQGVRQAGETLRRAVRRRRTGPWHAMVERFEPAGLSGWVEVPEDAPPVRVALKVNGTEVMSTWASDRLERTGTGVVRGFSLEVGGLWQFCRREDKVTVRVHDERLPIAGHGLWLAPPEDGPRTVKALRKELARGMVFGRSGALQRSKALDTLWQEQVMALYSRTRALLSAELGLDVFLMYGSLLGAVREGGPISHDNDLDAAYVSRHTDPKQAARELQQIAFLLVERGFDVDCRRTTLHIHDSDDPRVRIDLFHTFFDEGGTLRFPFGAAGTTDLVRDDWQGVQETDFLGQRVLVPVCAEQLVEVLYGAGWRQPVPGFNWKRDRTQQARDAWMPRAYHEEVYWAGFYARNDFGDGSTFHDLVEARDELPRDVVDIGCGQGRDSFAFAIAGRRVTGIDRSHVGIRHAGAKAEQLGLSDRLSFSACDVSDVDALTAVFAQVRERAAGGPVLFYARFFLHSIPASVQEALLGIIRSSARPGDWFAAEFRTDKDEAGDKVHTQHYRRFQNGKQFGRRLSEVFGFEVVEEQEGTGLSPYKGEDPELYRVLARRP